MLRRGQIKYVFIERPIRLFVSNWVIFAFFFLAVTIDQLFKSHFETIQLAVSSEFVFSGVPALLARLTGSPFLMTMLLVVFLVKTIVVTVIATDLMLIYQRHRASFVKIFQELRFRNIVWFLLAQLIVYIVFGGFAIASYQAVVIIKEKTLLDLYFVLFILFALLYPLYYICLSVSSMVAVFPRPGRRKVSDALFLLHLPRIWKLYLFYILRLGLEGVLILVVPLLALTVAHSPTLAALSVAGGLLVPFALIRGASYELKLLLYGAYDPVRNIFPIHYHENERQGIRL